MNFRVGQKVVCVNTGCLDEWPGVWGPTEVLVEGGIYTVARCFADDDGLILHLVEVSRDAQSRATWGDDVGYCASRFRPVVERKTDISIFQKMLTPAPKKRATVLSDSE